MVVPPRLLLPADDRRPSGTAETWAGSEGVAVELSIKNAFVVL